MYIVFATKDEVIKKKKGKNFKFSREKREKKLKSHWNHFLIYFNWLPRYKFYYL